MKEASGARAKRDAYDDFLDGIEWLNAPASAEGSAGKAAKKRASASKAGAAKAGGGKAAKPAAEKKDSAKAATGERKPTKADAAETEKAKARERKAAKAAAEKPKAGAGKAADRPTKPGEGTEKSAKPKSAAKPAAARKKAAPKVVQSQGDLLSAWAELSGEPGERRSLVASRPAANSASKPNAAGKKASSSRASVARRPAQNPDEKPSAALLTMPFDADAPQRSGRRVASSLDASGGRKGAAAAPEKRAGEAASRGKSSGRTAAQRAQESQGRSGGAAARSKASGRSAKKGGGNRNSRARRGGELFFAVDGRDPFDDYLDATGPRPPRGGRRTSGLTAFLAVCIAAILGLAGWQAVRYQDFLTMKSAVAEQGFYDGTTVEGIDVSDMTLESALAYWEAEVEPAYAQRTVSLDSGTTLTAAQLGYSSDYAAVLARAWNAGQTGSLEERYARIAERQAQPASYSVTRTLYTDSAIESFAESMAAQIDRPAQDAALESFDVDSFQFTYVEEVAGSRLDAQALARDIAQALDAGGGSVALSVESIQPEVTVASLSSQYGMIAYAVTNASSSSSNRLTNIALSLELINGTRLDPGETFSFNETVGERTTDRGFKVATAYSSGEVTEEVGGGICQVSTTLFNAAVKSDMEIVERHNHSLTVSYVDLGKDAAVDWGNKDLRFTNTGDEPVYIVCLLTDDKRVRIGFFGKLLPNGESITVEGETTGTIGYETVYQPNLSFPSGYSEVTQRGRNGYTAVAYKIRWDAEGNQISSELLCSSTYRTTNEIIEYGP